MTNREFKPGSYLATALVTFALSGGLAACGELKTNPVSDYPELKDSVRPHTQKARTQTYIESALFQLEAEESLVFMQGAATSVNIKSQLRLDGVAYELFATGLPEGASFTSSTEADHAGQYKLSWRPSPNTLSDQEPYREIKFQIGLKLTSVSDRRAAEIVKAIGHPREFKMVLVRSNEQPLVEKVEMPVNQIQEGESLAFTVIVNDAGAGSREPQLLVARERGASQESLKLDGTRFVSIDPEPKPLGEGRFQFSGLFDTKGVELPGTGEVIPARFVFVVVSRSGLPGVNEVVEIKVARKPKPAPVPASTAKAKEKEKAQ